MAESPSSPPIVAVADSILPQEHAEVLSAASMAAPRDVPGPSTLFLPDSEHPEPPPRVPSPPLPNLADRDDEDDEVVSTLPVYMSPALHPALTLFQYPLQHRSLRVPQWAADRGKRITTRVKEGVGRVEIEVPVDGDPKVWRDERARDLGFTPDVKENGEERGKKKAPVPEKWGDKMRLRSEPVPVPGGALYYSGIVHDGALHLHPVSRVLQFRTALGYVDDYDAKNRRGTRLEEEEEKKKAAQRKDMPKHLDDPKNDGSGSIKDFRNKMWAMTQKEDEDKWVPYEWHDGVDDESVTEPLERLLVPEDRRTRLECVSRPLDILDRE